MIEYLYSNEGCNLQRPQLIISVTGGAQNFTIPYRMKKAFKLGLIKAAASTGAWIITGGTNTGVMRLVGEALAEEYHKYNTNLTVLGIATWGTIEFKEKLVVSIFFSNMKALKKTPYSNETYNGKTILSEEQYGKPFFR